MSVFVCLLSLSCARSAAETPPLDFNRDIRPLLSDKCFACHGFDANTRKAGLRLDLAEGAYRSRDSNPAITPGDLQASELWNRITSEDPDEVMPPPESLKELSRTEKEVLRRWIEQGAKYQPHWAFIAPQRPEIPTEPEAEGNPIDSFIFSRLAKEGLTPSPKADRATLIRRVTLDLTGLPPTPGQLTAFFDDTKPGAYKRLVDRLISSRDYAERRAQDWLDLARYADTRGFADDKMRQIWPYRDWVIRALHENMSFDQFTIEQLAGDMLPNATAEQRLATGFHRNAPQARGETYPVEEFRVKGVTDRVNTTARVWLGLTMECAECHDHKFDPISQRDYFSLFAIFNNIEHTGKGFSQGGPTMIYHAPAAVPDSQIADQWARLKRELAEARERLPAPGPVGAEDYLEKWDGPSLAQEPTQYAPRKDLTLIATITTRQNAADLVSKYDWRGKQRSFVFGIGGEGEKEATPGHLFFWASSNPDPFDGITVYGSKPVNDGNEHEVAVVFKAGDSAKLYIDGIEDTKARITGKAPEMIAPSNRRLSIGSGYSNSTTPNAYRFEGTMGNVRLYDRALRFLPEHEELHRRSLALQRFEKEHLGEARHVPVVPVMKERAVPRETFIHLRGNFLNPGEIVFPAVPIILAKSGATKIADRLEFARWLVDGKNPLVARVVVNRFWQSYFGRGLVQTPADFGAQGASPTHPDLLDWLAVEFVESGWDMKHLNRLIVTSKTYQQAARITSLHRERDPDNLLLARMPRVRLPAEQIRDQALFISGLLKSFPGGPAVFPPQPADYWKELDLPGIWETAQDEDRHRKSLYTYWRRMALHPTMELLDAPSRAVCTVKRHHANLPTQALVTLNAPVFVEAAEHFARRLLEEAPDTLSRLDLAFQLCLARKPEKAEKERFLQFLEGKPPHEANGDLSELPAWRSIATVLLNLDETITRP